MSHTVPGHVSRFSRLYRGIDQIEAAALMGVHQTQLSAWERGKGTIPPERWTRAEQRLAVGQPGARESSLTYLLATCQEPHNLKLRFDFLHDEYGQIGFYTSPTWATRVADALASLGLPGACAVPCWRSFARGLLKERPRDPRQPGARLYQVDDWGHEETNHLAMAEHLQSVVRDLRNGPAAVVKAAVIPCVPYSAKSTDDPRGSIETQHADIRTAMEREGDRCLYGDPQTDEGKSAFKGDRGPNLVDPPTLTVTHLRERCVATGPIFGANPGGAIRLIGQNDPSAETSLPRRSAPRPADPGPLHTSCTRLRPSAPARRNGDNARPRRGKIGDC